MCYVYFKNHQDPSTTTPETDWDLIMESRERNWKGTDLQVEWREIQKDLL